MAFRPRYGIVSRNAILNLIAGPPPQQIHSSVSRYCVRTFPTPHTSATLAKKSPAVTSPPGFQLFPVSTLRKNEWMPSASLSRSIYRNEEAAGRRNSVSCPKNTSPFGRRFIPSRCVPLARRPNSGNLFPGQNTEHSRRKILVPTKKMAPYPSMTTSCCGRRLRLNSTAR